MGRNRRVIETSFELFARAYNTSTNFTTKQQPSLDSLGKQGLLGYAVFFIAIV